MEDIYWECYYCGWYGKLDEDEDECPNCGEDGYLEPH